VDAVDYEAATSRLVRAAERRQALAASALAVHGIMIAWQRPGYRDLLNSLDIVTPDGQPVRWALNLLYRLKLPKRVYGPELTGRVMGSLSDRGLPAYFYGSRREVLDRLVNSLRASQPDLRIAGVEAGKYRPAREKELDEIAERISRSGARFLFVGLGCPRQEIFCAALRPRLDVPLLAVGAAFDYHAGLLQRPPESLQRFGLEWLWRLCLEPRRLWRRYVLLNPAYLVLVASQRLGLWTPEANVRLSGASPRVEV
jgi:exopolysaccharide biosynthesis WecB/TagA/CpsF family protein